MNGTTHHLTETDIRTRKPDNIAVYTDPEHSLYLHKSPRPTPAPGQCLIHVCATGICGSDIHFWRKGAIGSMVVSSSHRLGHESAGIVLEIGEGVTRFKPGDRVAIECGIPCSKATCFYCRTGRYNACPDVVFCSTPPCMTSEEGSLLEPLSVALAGIDRSNVGLGDSLVVCGAGPIGITTLLAASAAGANPIVITDIDKTRLALAKKLVPRVRTVAIVLGKKVEDAAEDVKTALGQEAKVVIECTGVESSVLTAVYSCRFGGTVFVIGCGKDLQTLPFMHMSTREINLRFQYRYQDTYLKAIGLVSEGVIDVKPLVTHRITLEDSEKAFHIASDPAAMALKVQILDE